MTFPGPPSIYYGDEIGMRGGHDPGSRAGFPWNRPETWDNDLREITQELISLRSAHPALRTGSYRRLAPGPGEYGSWLYVMERRLGDNGFIVAVNAGDEDDSAGFDYHQQGSQLVWGQGQISTSDNRTAVTVPGRAAAIWRVQT